MPTDVNAKSKSQKTAADFATTSKHIDPDLKEKVLALLKQAGASMPAPMMAAAPLPCFQTPLQEVSAQSAKQTYDQNPSLSSK